MGLSLSLFVLLDDQIADRRYRTLSLFFMGITAFLTTLVQGTTMGPILQVKPCSTMKPYSGFLGTLKTLNTDFPTTLVQGTIMGPVLRVGHS